MWASPASKIIGEILFEKGSTYYNLTMLVKKKPQRDIPGCPVIKTSPSNAGGMGSIPRREAKILHASGPEDQNRSSIVTNLIKTLKMVHIKKKKRKKLPESEPYKTGSRDERYLVLGSLESSLSLSGMLKIFTA